MNVTDSNTPQASTSYQNEHDYTFSPSIKRKKLNDSEISKMYQQTVDVLKDIKNILDSRLGEISESLRDMANIVASRKGDIY